MKFNRGLFKTTFFIFCIFLNSNLFGEFAFEEEYVTANYAGIPKDVAFSPNGSYFAIGGNNYPDDVVVYEWSGSSLTGPAVLAKQSHNNFVESIAWSSGGDYLAVGGNASSGDVAVHSWDGSVLGDLGPSAKKYHGTTAFAVEFSPDGNYLAVGGEFLTTDIIVYSWNGSVLGDLPGAKVNFGTKTNDIAWSPDGNYLAVAGNQASGWGVAVYEWAAETLTLLPNSRKGIMFVEDSVSWSPDGNYLALVGRGATDLDVVIYEWDAGTGTLNKVYETEHGLQAYAVAWSADGSYIAVGGYNDPYDVVVYGWDSSSETLSGLGSKSTIDLASHATSLSWSPDDRHLAVCGIGVTVHTVEVLPWLNLNATDRVLFVDFQYTFTEDDAATGYVHFNKGIEFRSGAQVVFDIVGGVDEILDLGDIGRAILLQDLHLGTVITGGFLAGNGNSIILDDPGYIADDVVLHVESDTVIDGKGHDFEIGRRSQIFVDDNITLTLKNMKIKNIYNSAHFPFIRLASHRSRLALDNVIICPKDDFHFIEGQLFIHNDVVFTGTHSFVYNSTQPSYITSQATWTFEPRTIFKYDSFTSAPGNNGLILMEDENSNLFFNQCTLKSTTTGLQLTKGSLFFENFVEINNKEASFLSSIELKNAQDSEAFIIGDVDWSSDGRYVAMGQGSASVLTPDIFVYEFVNNTLVLTTSQYRRISSNHIVYSVAWSPDGKYLAAGGNLNGNLGIYYFDGASLTFTYSRRYNGNIFALSWSPDGSRIAVGGDEAASEIKIYAWDGSILSFVTDKDAVADPIYSLEWNPDGKYLATGADVADINPDVVVYELVGSSLVEKVSLQLYENYKGLVSWSPDGKKLAVAIDSNFEVSSIVGLIVYDWNGTTLTETGSAYTGLTANDVDWSPDGKYIGIAGRPTLNYPHFAQFMTYEFNGVSLILTDSKHSGNNVKALSWNPSGKHVVLGVDKTVDDVRVYEVSYITLNYAPPFENGFIFGDSSQGDAIYNVNMYILSDAQVDIQGSVFFDDYVEPPAAP